MQKLADGVHAFRAGVFAKHRRLFHTLVDKGQTPDALFITCSDSRIDPNMITSAHPGDLFTVRNVGNVVPQVTLPGGTAAAIEYAVDVLNVPNIVVCGHTHCGAIQAMLNPEQMDNLQFVKRWLKQSDRLREIVKERYSHLEGPSKMTAAAEENVLVQLENLRAFPSIAQRIDDGRLRIAGWIFKIETGEVFEYDPTTHQFVDISSASSHPPSVQEP
jgi:carbonic anhydrase